MKKVLVTGANGQLGKTFKELFQKNEYQIEFTFVTKEQLDITDIDKLITFFSINFFHYCINCAAYTNVDQAEKTPEIAFRVNADGTRNLADICHKKNIILIHISTDYVFDGEKKLPYETNDKTNPINEYGKSKLKGEEYVQNILNKYLIIRTSWLYSKKYGKNFYRTILEKIQKENKLSITDEQIGCPTDTTNLSNYIFELIKDNRNNYGVHHFCDGKVMTWYDFAKNILKENEYLNKIKLIKANKYITFARRPKYSVLKMDNIVMKYE
ncbi:dTDP-4-dehydrorhamnose reductase [Hyunsoonleella pacifica]|uniref:dTDP-4-dehydrorhamnose reductase n=1 Tax=Hyunsoonleella pacifica TaxID=1080224 RepID=A0A4Q9FPB0_9FLAO|nr:dTDP-4-dehydrorhamnose reductase [Hyunsoonleella pacifica]TBN16730.1 dTDP-4-dehydrorhamnose reductase [Hyunsoonleella pacifica]GGD16931.1 NAD(P)-dependent oxidoreductase [Hyunsoonleella pacifica]